MKEPETVSRFLGNFTFKTTQMFRDINFKSDIYTDIYERSSKLGKDYMNVAKAFRNELEPIGLSFKKNGTMNVDDGLLVQSLNKNDISDTFSGLNKFKNVLLRKTNQVLLDPMEYVDKVVIAYKNPGKAFFTPYIPSIYSGMIFNGWY